MPAFFQLKSLRVGKCTNPCQCRWVFTSKVSKTLSMIFFYFLISHFEQKDQKLANEWKKWHEAPKNHHFLIEIFDKKVKFDRSNCILRKALKISAESGNIYECQEKQGRNLEKSLTEFLPCFFTSWIYPPPGGGRFWPYPLKCFPNFPISD